MLLTDSASRKQMTAIALSPTQAHALFDILTHHEAYKEIENFKWPEAIHQYGPPFTKEEGVISTSPLLQMLFTKFAIKLPGLSSVSEEFWKERCQSIVEKLGAAELSESYDKGAIGQRKTLATAIATLLEYPARGCLGGYPKHDVKDDQDYEITNSTDVQQGWEDFIQQLIYGDMIDSLFEAVKKTDKLEDHTLLLQAAHEYILVNVATFLHHIFILSPDGQALLRNIANVHKLVPYSIIRQTLRVGNAATMINGMVKLILAKMSVSTLTNWMGISKDADEGMNLLQQIISTVLVWDSVELQKRALKIEKMKEGPSKEHLETIKDHIQKRTREDRDSTRSQSIAQSISITTAIFTRASLPTDLTPEQHSLAHQYLTMHLGIHDRDQLTRILCRSNPDQLTQAIRELVGAYEPIIRNIHNAVDLSATLTDFENFMNDFILLSRLPEAGRKKKPGSQVPSRNASPAPGKDKGEVKEEWVPVVEDYLSLLKKHVNSIHRFLHQIAKNGPEVTSWYYDFAKAVVAEFRMPETGPESGADESGAGAMTSTLNQLVEQLDEKDQVDVRRVLDEHHEYLETLQAFSEARMHSILSIISSFNTTQVNENGNEKSKSRSGTQLGPGIYLARWQGVLDATLITPATPQGPVRSGKNKDVQEAAMVDVDGETKGVSARMEKDEGPKPPNVEIVIKLLAGKFAEALAAGID